jgi:hypothetical protein
MKIARRFFDQLDDGAGQFLGALAAFRPMAASRRSSFLSSAISPITARASKGLGSVSL